jgi:hypothetical protein
VDTIVTCVQLGQMILVLGKNWLMRGENTLVTSTIQQKMLPVKDARVKVIISRISNAKRRPCAKAKGLDSCAQCDEFPCKKMSKLMGSTTQLLTLLAPKFKDITEEEFNLCVQQWNSMPNLVRILVEEGKLPQFILDRI